MQYAAILQLVQAAITAAPDVFKVGMEAYNFIRAAFTMGVITEAEQNALFEFVNKLCSEALAGNRPPELVVDPDPS